MWGCYEGEFGLLGIRRGPAKAVVAGGRGMAADVDAAVAGDAIGIG